jgi:hypothetical protein
MAAIRYLVHLDQIKLDLALGLDEMRTNDHSLPFRISNFLTFAFTYIILLISPLICRCILQLYACFYICCIILIGLNIISFVVQVNLYHPVDPIYMSAVSQKLKNKLILAHLKVLTFDKLILAHLNVVTFDVIVFNKS